MAAVPTPDVLVADLGSPTHAELSEQLLGSVGPEPSGSLRRLSLRSGSRSLLPARSRSDLQVALAWLEGEEGEEAGGRGARARWPGAIAGLAEEACAEPAEEAAGGATQAASGAQAPPPGKEPPPASSRGRGAGVLAAALRVLRPAFLWASTLASAVFMLSVQRPLVEAFFGGSSLFTASVACTYGLTLVCMLFVASCDPGALSDEAFKGWQAGRPLPRRAHKNFRYERPILRFDHYCRWIANCIGLNNHREFMAMTAGLVAGALLGVLADATLGMVCLASDTSPAWIRYRQVVPGLAAHLAYSAGFLYFAVPILRLHVGFVSRNELANEWKHDDFYVVRKSPVGEPIWVNELDVDEYNEYFDHFEYDPTRNSFDKGWKLNCWAFWCTARRAPGQLGEF